jgi:uncharacterized membrane protein YhaH (DUF805 family)
VREEVISVNNEPGEKQGLLQLLFTFRGRISRKPYWLCLFATFVPAVMVAGIGAEYKGTGMLLLESGVVVVLVWTSLALQVKRWHDRGKSGWWVLINLVPVVGAIWSLVEIGFFRGTLGGNAFGGDPTDLY